MLTAREERLTQVEPAMRLLLRTLWFTIIFGIITTFSYGINLIPAFGGADVAIQGLQIQVKSDDADGQNFTLDLLRECANRKVEFIGLLDSLFMHPSLFRLLLMHSAGVKAAARIRLLQVLDEDSQSAFGHRQLDDQFTITEHHQAFGNCKGSQIVD